MSTVQTVGEWFLIKWRKRLADSGDVQVVALQMRKSGIPLEIARLALLTGLTKPTNGDAA